MYTVLLEVLGTRPKKVYVNSRNESSSIATTEVGAMMWAVKVLENILRRDIDIDHKVAKLFCQYR